MSSISSLKREAREAESREDWIEAIELYGRAVAKAREEGAIPFEISLYNRIGDLYLELDDTSQAVYHYLLAAEQYAGEEMHPSAVALCRKVLRVAPDQVDAYRQLAKLHVQTGLIADARHEFERYLDGIRETGEIRGAVPEIADLVEELSEEPVELDEARRLAEEGEWEEAFRRVVAAWEGEELAEAPVGEPDSGEEPGIEATDGARDLAVEHGIDLAELDGSGRDGRIVEADVQIALAELEEATEARAEQEEEGEAPGDSTIPGLLVELEAELTEAEWSLDAVPPSGEAGEGAEDAGADADEIGERAEAEAVEPAAGPRAGGDETDGPEDAGALEEDAGPAGVAGAEESAERTPERGPEETIEEPDAAPREEPSGEPDAGEEAPGLAAEAGEEPAGTGQPAATGDEAGPAEPLEAVDEPDLDELLEAAEEGLEEPAPRGEREEDAPEEEAGTPSERPVSEPATEPAGAEAEERIDPEVLVAAADALSSSAPAEARLRTAVAGAPALLPDRATAAAEAGLERHFPTPAAPWRRAWSRREAARDRAVAAGGSSHDRERRDRRPGADLPGGIAAESRRPAPSLLWLADAMAEAVAASRGEPVYLRRALGPSRERERAAARALEETAAADRPEPALTPAAVGAPALLPARATAAEEAGMEETFPVREPPWRRAWSGREAARDRAAAAAAGASAEEARRPAADLPGGIAARSRRPAPSLLWLADAMAEAVAASRGEPVYLRRALGPSRERERAAARALEETAAADRPEPALTPAAVGAPALLPARATAAASAGVDRTHPPSVPPWRRAWSRRRSARARASADGRRARASLAAARGSGPWRDPEPGGVRVAPRRARPAGPDGPLFGTPGRIDYLPAGAEADGGGEASGSGLDWLASAVETILEPGLEAAPPGADDADAAAEELLDEIVEEESEETSGAIEEPVEPAAAADGAVEEPAEPAAAADGAIEEPAEVEPATEAEEPADEVEESAEAIEEPVEPAAAADGAIEEPVEEEAVEAAEVEPAAEAEEPADEVEESAEPEGTEEEARWIAGPRPVTDPDAARRLWDALVEAGPFGTTADREAAEAGPGEAGEREADDTGPEEPADGDAAPEAGEAATAPEEAHAPGPDQIPAAADDRPEPEAPAGDGDATDGAERTGDAAGDAAEEEPGYELPEPEPGPPPTVELSSPGGPDFTALLEHIGWIDEDDAGRSGRDHTSNGRGPATGRSGDEEAVARASTGAPWKRGPSTNGGGEEPEAADGGEDGEDDREDGDTDFTEMLQEIGWLEGEDRPRSS